ncbi:hypothetical protein CEF21_17945 [Bacillus sp. FJAT-42376]|uniref:hypothetical protein n=1 Tax=Bacillus sp. FJAT-42376 TaxID=2014076 RepID=UPI000F4E971E|nr:hypothetical protein [Bacillus sp. FJAT-42376]AZB44046.1 hypothetical protein CEF21_17945 [Bacillus sp. FJAT-42376]
MSGNTGKACDVREQCPGTPEKACDVREECPGTPVKGAMSGNNRKKGEMSGNNVREHRKKRAMSAAPENHPQTGIIEKKVCDILLSLIFYKKILYHR